MAQDIEDRVKSCEICAKHQNVNAKEPMIMPEIPDRPWSKIAADLFEYQSQHYLLVVDYFSRSFEIGQSIKQEHHCIYERTYVTLWIC